MSPPKLLQSLFRARYSNPSRHFYLVYKLQVDAILRFIRETCFWLQVSTLGTYGSNAANELWVDSFDSCLRLRETELAGVERIQKQLLVWSNCFNTMSE